MFGSLDNALQSIQKHPAINNDFYDAWTGDVLAPTDLKVFAQNYLAWVESFPNALALLVQSEADIAGKTMHARTLYSELGYGDAEKAHSVLLRNFLRSLSSKLNLDGDLAQAVPFEELLASTQALIDGEMWLYGHKRRAFAAGGQLALEWQAYTMLRKLYDGARNYIHLWNNPDEFHEDCEYFYVHIGAAEKDHKQESLQAVQLYISDASSKEQMFTGFNAHLDLIQKFWDGLSRSLSSSAEKTYSNAGTAVAG